MKKVIIIFLFLVSNIYLVSAQLPTVLSFNPLDNATEVSVNTNLTINFDRAVRINNTNPSASLYFSLWYYDSGEEKDARFAYVKLSNTGEITTSKCTINISKSVSSSTVVVSLSSPLNPDVDYWITIGSGLFEAASTGADYGGFSDPTVWNFTSEIPGPTILSYDPLQDDTDVDVNKVIQLTFNENISFNPSGIYNIEVWEDGVETPHHTFTITSGSPSSGASINNDVLSLDMPVSMGNSAVYYVLVDNDAILSSNTGVGFDGILNPYDYMFITADKVPILTSYNPIPGSIDVPVSQTLVLTFDENIVFNSSSTSLFIDIYEVDNTIPVYSFYARYGNGYGGLSISGSNLYMNPTVDLNSSTSYYVLMQSGVVCSYNTSLPFGGISSSSEWTFTTEIVIPSIVSYDPLQGAIDVPVDTILSLEFSENISFNPSGTFSIDIYKDGVGTPYHSFTITDGTPSQGATVSNDSLLLDLPIDFETSTVYYVLIEENALVSSVSGTPFGGISDVNEWRFTTITPPPVILSYSPLQNAEDVLANQLLELTFNENIVKGSSGRFNIYNSDDTEFASFATSNASASVSGAVLTVSHPDFVEGASYYITIDDGFVKSSSTGVNFAGFSDVNQWRFTVEVPAPIAAIIPVDGSTKVSIYESIVVTYDQAVRNTDGTTLDDTNVASLITLMDGINPITFTATISIDKTVITVVPDSPLPGNSTIDISVAAVENNYGNEQSGPSTSSFHTDQFFIWDGDNSTSFSDPLNWAGDSYINGYSVIIPAGVVNSPVISSSLNSASYVIIEPGANLTISSGGAITIDKEFVLESSNDAGVGNASFLNEGTLTMSPGAVTKIHQKVTDSPVKWYFMSSPVSNATQNSINCDGGVSYYDASNLYWQYISASAPMTVGQGYRVYSYSDMTFTGTINNNTSYSFNAVRVVGDNSYGWNLAGNPYPCAIDWDSPSVTKTNLNNLFYVWLNDTRNYGTYNGNAGLGTNVSQLTPSQIPSGHAFWVQVPIGQTNGSLTIGSGARTHNSMTYLKAPKIETKQVLRIAGVNNKYEDEALIAFIPEASDTFDIFDSEKLFSSGDDLLEVFFVDNTKELTIDCYSSFTGYKTIPVGIKAAKKDTFGIKLVSINNFPVDIKVELIDVDSLITVDLTNQNEYNFIFNGGKNTSRFLLKMSSKLTSVNSTHKVNIFDVYSVDNNVFINVPDVEMPYCRFYDVDGRLIKESDLQSGVLNNIELYYNGIVLVKVISNKGVFTKKILINK
ncbi:MAG: Ig-like domain-containing protein [Marinilabiliaceae bacterium]|nr:Ig-like domain-containing protein [Marinilabiliaceae bacterium]